MDGWGFLVWLASAGFMVSLLPQLVRTLRRRRADDLSLPFLLRVLASSAYALPYFLHRGEAVFAGAQAVNLGVWGTVLYFRVAPPLEAPRAPSS